MKNKQLWLSSGLLAHLINHAEALNPASQKHYGKCEKCNYFYHPDGGHCYMFREYPGPNCGQFKEVKKPARR